MFFNIVTSPFKKLMPSSFSIKFEIPEREGRVSSFNAAGVLIRVNSLNFK